MNHLNVPQITILYPLFRNGIMILKLTWNRLNESTAQDRCPSNDTKRLVGKLILLKLQLANSERICEVCTPINKATMLSETYPAINNERRFKNEMHVHRLECYLSSDNNAIKLISNIIFHNFGYCRRSMQLPSKYSSQEILSSLLKICRKFIWYFWKRQLSSIRTRCRQDVNSVDGAHICDSICVHLR